MYILKTLLVKKINIPNVYDLVTRNVIDSNNKRVINIGTVQSPTYVERKIRVLKS